MGPRSDERGSEFVRLIDLLAGSFNGAAFG